MEHTAIASRYARALLEASAGTSEVIAEQLSQLVEFLGKNNAVRTALENPVLPKAQRQALTEGLIAACEGVQLPLANVLRLLTARTKFSLLPALSIRFQSLVDEKMGRLRGSVTSAHRLSAQQVDSVRVSLEALTRKKITLEQKIDATVLGGIVAQVGSTIFDGSLRNELAQLHTRLTGR